MKQTLAILAGVALLAACMDRPPPTGLAQSDIEAPVASIEPLAPLPSPLIPIEDVLSRVLSGLSESVGVDELRTALDELAAVLRANDGCLLQPSRRAAEAALRRVQGQAPAELGAELAVVELALGAVGEYAASRCER